MDEPPSKKSRADSDYDSGLDALSALESLEAFPTSSKDTDVDNNPSTSAGGSGGPSGSTPHPQGTPQPAPSNNGGFNLQPGQSQPQQPPQNMGGGVNGSVLQELLMNPSQTSNNSPRPQAYPPGQQNAFNRSPMMPNGTPNMMSPPSMGRVPGPSPGGPQPPGPGQPQMRPGQPGMFQGDQQQQMMMGAQGQQFPGMMHRYPYAQGGPPPGAQGMPQGYPGVSRGGPTPGQPMGRGAMMNGAMPRSGPMPTQGRPGIPPNQQAMMQPMMTDRQFMQHGQYGQQRPEFMQQYGRPGGYPMMHQGMMMDSNGQPIRGPNQMMMMSNGHPGMSHGPPNGQPGPQAAAAQHAAQQQAAAQAQAQAAAQQQQQQQREQEAAAAAQRNGAGRATTPGSSMLATHQDPEKRKLIQQQLVLLLHAHKCSQREKLLQENRDFAAKNQPPPHAACTLPHCSTMKEVLTHMTSCNVGRLCHSDTTQTTKKCSVAHCASSRQIIAHWKNCSREDCPVCKPLKRIQDTPLQFSLPDLANLIGVNGNSNGSAEGDGLHQFGSPAMRTGNITNSLFEGFNGNPFQNGPNRGGPRPPGGNGEIPNLPPPDMPDCTKEWHHQVTKDLRNHLVGKLVKAIFPEPNQEAMNDNRLKDLIAYARKVEKEMFESANDREEYYHLLAEKIYKIQKELQEKKNSRLNQGAAAHDQYAIPPSNELAQMLGVEGGRSDVHSEGSSMAVAPSQQNQPWGGAPNSNMHQQIPPNGQVPQVNNSSTFPSSGNSTPNIGASSTVSAMLQPKTEPMDDQNTDSLSSRPPTAIGFGGSSSSTPAPIMNGIVKKEEDPEESSNQAPPSVKDTKDGVAESKPKEQQAKREPTPPPTEDTVFSQEDLIKFLLPVWEKLDKSEDAAPFRVPVDAKLLNIPDYHEIIKRPMDLETVHKKLYAGQYQNAGQFCDDIWLMLDNAWLYNRKNSKVYKYGLKLSEMFVSEMDPVMKSMGYCCAKKLAFTPLSLFCYGAAMCTIAREQQYWVFEQSSTQYNVTVTERYTYCQKCFDALPPEGISLSENPNDRNNMAPKTSFTEQKNSVIDYEPFERCKYCMRKWHRICALHDKKVYPEGFICECCRTAKKYQKPDNKYLASKLPHNKLSTFLEDRVNGFIKKQLQAEAHKYPVIIRTLCVQDKEAEVKAQMKQKYVESNQFPEKFPYRTKAVFAFEIIDGVEVCFFGLHVQEYGSACPAPNARRVYIAYLDSVHFFQPRELRTDVYHELLLGYLDYAKMLGYTMAHIWACPPSEGDDYIFHCHPPEQKIPKPKRLQDWYKKMLEKGVQEGSVVEFKDIYKQARDDNLTTPTQLPYFEGDFWPNVIEDCIREASNEEAQRKVKEDDDDGEDADGGLGGGDSGKKKSSKNKKNNLKKNAKMNKKKAGSITGNEVADKLYSQFEKHKEVFFTIRLVSLQNEPAVLAKPISDPDGLMQSDMMDGRDTFLTKAREEHWEFSSLRRAKYSTLCLAYSLHETDSKGMEYTCNKCSSPAVWHCQSCDDFDLCDGCKPTTQHPHEMEKIKSLIGGGEAGDSAAGGTRYESIQRCIASLVHACQCRDANCRRMSCHKMKRVVQHTKMCKKRINGTCPVCKQLIALCCYHAKHCTRDACTVPFCMNIRQKLAEQKRSQQRRADMMMRRRMEGLQSHVGGAAPTPSTVSNGTPSNAPTPPVSAGPGPAVKGGGVGQVQMQQHQGSHVGGSGPAGMGQPMNSFGGMPGMGLGPNAQNGPGLPGMNPQMNANQSRYMPNGPGLGQSGAPGQQQQPMYSSGMPMQRPGGLGGMNPQQQPQQQQGHPGLQNPGGRPGGVHGMGQNQPVRNNQDMVMNMQMQNQHQQPPPFDSTLQPQIMKINSRLKAAKTEEERETVFSDLKKTPHLFHAWLRQQQLQQQQAGAMRGGGGFAPGQNNSQPRAPSGQFASMNPSMQQQYPQQQQGWPQQRQQNPGGMQQNANPYNQFQNRQNMMMMPQQQQPHPSNAGGQ